MALPSSGQISFSDLNVERGLAANLEVDLATAGDDFAVSYTTDGTDFLSMDEFYGLSSGPDVTLYVSIRDIAVPRVDVTVTAKINNSPPFDIWNTATDGPLSNSCVQRYTMTTPLAEDDIVTFSTTQLVPIAGNENTTCPTSVGSATSKVSSAMVLGNNYMYLTIKSNINV